jgi:hypothetical protein
VIEVCCHAYAKENQDLKVSGTFGDSFGVLKLKEPTFWTYQQRRPEAYTLKNCSQC